MNDKGDEVKQRAHSRDMNRGPASLNLYLKLTFGNIKAHPFPPSQCFSRHRRSSASSDEGNLLGTGVKYASVQVSLYDRIKKRRRRSEGGAQSTDRVECTGTLTCGRNGDNELTTSEHTSLGERDLEANSILSMPLVRS